MRGEGRTLDAAGMVDALRGAVQPLPDLLDRGRLAEDDWDGWKLLTDALGKKVQLVGDDLFVTNTERLREGIERGHRQQHPGQGQPDRHADARRSRRSHLAHAQRLHQRHVAPQRARPRTPRSPTWPSPPTAARSRPARLPDRPHGQVQPVAADRGGARELRHSGSWAGRSCARAPRPRHATTASARRTAERERCVAGDHHRERRAALWHVLFHQRRMSSRATLVPFGDALLLSSLMLATSALLAGALNALAGGGTFLTLPALLYTGVPARRGECHQHCGAPTRLPQRRLRFPSQRRPGGGARRPPAACHQPRRWPGSVAAAAGNARTRSSGWSCRGFCCWPRLCSPWAIVWRSGCNGTPRRGRA